MKHFYSIFEFPWILQEFPAYDIKNDLEVTLYVRVSCISLKATTCPEKELKVHWKYRLRCDVKVTIRRAERAPGGWESATLLLLPSPPTTECASLFSPWDLCTGPLHSTGSPCSPLSHPELSGPVSDPLKWKWDPQPPCTRAPISTILGPGGAGTGGVLILVFHICTLQYSLLENICMPVI